MLYFGAVFAVFFIGYLVNTTMITVFYHRGLAHRAVDISPRMRRFVARWGNWLTGLDPKGWVCMHRLHHAHSDTEDDPHSPVHEGLFRLAYTQLVSYEKILVGLAKRKEPFTSTVADLDDLYADGHTISWLNRKGMWWLPYVLHLTIGIVIAVAGFWAIGVAYFLGIMSHPIEGWIINAFGHAYGGRNFDTNDNSRNNHIAAWLIQGEGFQNNHHQYPSSAKFSYRWYEIDPGWGMCRLLDAIGMVKINREKLIPKPDQVRKQARRPTASRAAASKPITRAV